MYAFFKKRVSNDRIIYQNIIKQSLEITDNVINIYFKVLYHIIAGGFATLVSTLTAANIANKNANQLDQTGHSTGSGGHNTPNNEGMSASNSSSNLMASSGFKAAANRIVYGRLRRVPKLPAKPVLQSSESSSATDDLSGSEESNSSSIDDGDGDRDVDPTGGSAGTCQSGSEDEQGPDDFDLLGNGGSSSRDMCIEIKVSKDNDKSKMQQMSGSNAGKQMGQRGGIQGVDSGSGGNSKGGNSESASSWMQWNPERTSRTNQDHQREREETSMRLLIKHLTRRNRQAAARHQVTGGGPSSSSPKILVQGRWNHSGQGMAPPGGIFFRLEQDWRETHLAYLQHRSVSTHAANAHSVSSSLSSPNLRVSTGLTRPTSAASMKSAKYTRAAAMHR